MAASRAQAVEDCPPGPVAQRFVCSRKFSASPRSRRRRARSSSDEPCPHARSAFSDGVHARPWQEEPLASIAGSYREPRCGGSRSENCSRGRIPRGSRATRCRSVVAHVWPRTHAVADWRASRDAVMLVGRSVSSPRSQTRREASAVTVRGVKLARRRNELRGQPCRPDASRRSPNRAAHAAFWSWPRELHAIARVDGQFVLRCSATRTTLRPNAASPAEPPPEIVAAAVVDPISSRLRGHAQLRPRMRTFR